MWLIKVVIKLFSGRSLQMTGTVHTHAEALSALEGLGLEFEPDTFFDERTSCGLYEEAQGQLADLPKGIECIWLTRVSS